jgi:hypothetical protein
VDIKEQGEKIPATGTRVGKGRAAVAVQEGTSVFKVIQCRNMTEWKDVSEIEKMYKRLRKTRKKRKRKTDIKSEGAV